MAFGIVHYVYAINAVAFTTCVLLLLRRYIKERNTLTMIFTLVMSFFSVLCYGYVLRGIYATDTYGSILAYKLSIVASVVAPSLLLIFMLYPSIIQKGGFRQAGLQSGIVAIISILTIVIGYFIVVGEATLSYTHLAMDIYNVTYGALSYVMLLALPIVLGVIDSLGFASMAYREKDSFYRTRALLLTIGWTLCVIGSLMLLSETTLLLNPILFGTGGILMSIGILRQPS